LNDIFSHMTQMISRNHSRKPSVQRSNQLSVEIRKNENTTEKGLISAKKDFCCATHCWT